MSMSRNSKSEIVFWNVELIKKIMLFNGLLKTKAGIVALLSLIFQNQNQNTTPIVNEK